MRRVSVVAFLLFLVVSLTGCPASDRAFVRKLLKNHVDLTCISLDGTPIYASGIAYSAHRVISCAHVVLHSRSISHDDSSEIAKLIAIDPINDIAIIEFANTTFQPTIRFADHVQVGEPIFAYANSFGVGHNFEKYMISRIDDREVYIFPAPNPGGSGGMLCNQKGELVGMTSMSSTSRGAGIGKIIPAPLLEQFIKEHVQ